MSRRQSKRGGACEFVPRFYTGAWHYQGEQKCKGDPPRNNSPSPHLNAQVKAFAEGGGNNNNNSNYNNNNSNYNNNNSNYNNNNNNNNNKNNNNNNKNNNNNNYSGGGCSGKLSIKNAMSRKNCQWERTNNGQAELHDPIKASRNNYSGGGCSGKLSIKNAMSRKNCQWERTNNGQAELHDPIKASRNNYSGGRRNKSRKVRRVGGTASSSASNAQGVATGAFANGRSGPVSPNGRLPSGAANKY